MSDEASWADYFAIQFYRLNESEVAEYDKALMGDKDLPDVTQGEIRRAIDQMRKQYDTRFKPTLYHLKKTIKGLRGERRTDFDMQLARQELRKLDPVERWDWIMQNTPEGQYACQELIPDLIDYCERILDGIEKPKMDFTVIRELIEKKGTDSA